MTRLVLLSQDDSIKEALQQTLREGVRLESWWPPEGDDAHAIVKKVGLDEPLVVLLGADLDVAHALDIALAFDEELPEIEVLLIASPTPALWKAALRAGVRDVLTPELSPEAVRDIVDRAIEVAHRRRANLTGEEARERAAKVITVLSPKGGAGKTTVATNLAIGLAWSAPKQVVLFDCDLQFGDVANALRLLPEATFGDSVGAGLTDITTLKATLTPHPSGLYALCAPDTPAEADDISGEHVARAISLLHSEFSYVIVDTDAGLGERTLAAVEPATDLVFICSTDVPSVRSLRKEVEALDIIGMTHQRRHFILNRSDARVGLGVDDIRATIHQPIDFMIPSSRSVPLSTNTGSPIIETDVSSPVAKALLPLIARFGELDIPAHDSAAGRKRLRRKKDL
jgi:pilus assembly protein CpaE